MYMGSSSEYFFDVLLLDFLLGSGKIIRVII